LAWNDWNGMQNANGADDMYMMMCPSAVCGRFINNTIISLVWFGSVWHDVCVCVCPILAHLFFVSFHIYLYDCKAAKYMYHTE
jgi:hypothetical protein